jgi:TP901 family phage tail tape measure protein
MDSISILIKAILEKSSKQQLEQELQQIEKKLKPINVEVNTNSESQIKLHKSLQKIYQEEEKQRLNQEKASAKALADKEKILQYEQKVRKAIEDSNIKEQQKTKELQEQISLFQKRMQLESGRISGKYGSLVDNKSLGSLQSDIEGLTSSTPNVTKKMKDFSLGMKEVELNAKNSAKAIKNTKQDSISFFEDISRSAFKFTEWYLLAGGITSVIDAIKNGVSYITQLDNSLNEIRIVTGKTQEQVNNLAQSYNNLAKEMSVTTSEIAGEAANLFRQGLNESEVEERMKAIIQYAKISSISLESSDQIITATANATGENVQKIIDIFAMLGDSTASGADEIGEALQRVASAAENSGISIEKSASWISTISSITRESASTIGRSLNSIISRYEQIKSKGFNSEDATKLNDVVKALSDIGITATDSMGQLRPFADVMDEVGAKFNTLSKNEQAYITTAMFGTFQRNKGLTLLRNYNQSLENYETALNSAGTAEQKFNIYQESTQAKLDALKASIEGFWQSTIDSSLIKGTIDGLTSLINTLGNLPTAITAIVTAIALWKGTQLTKFLTTSKVATDGWRVALIANRGAVIGLTEAEIAAKTATTGWALSWNALKVAFMSNPIGAIATVILTAVTAIDIFNQKQEEARQKSQEIASGLQNEISGLKDLKQQYTDIINSGDITSESKERLKSIQEQLIKTFSLEADAIDLVNGKYKDQIDVIDEVIAKKAHDYTTGQLTEYQRANKELSSKSSYDFGVSYIALNTTRAIERDKIDKAITDATGKNYFGFGAEKLTLEDYKKVLDEVITKQKEYNQVKSKSYIGDNLLNDLTNEFNRVNNLITENQSIIDKYVDNKNVEDFYNKYKEQISQVHDLQNKLLNEKDNSKKSVIQKQIDKVKDSITSSSGYISDYKDFVSDLFKTETNSANESSNAIGNNIANLKTLTDTYDEQTQKVQQLIAFRAELNSKEGLSAKSMQEIIKNHQELIPYLDDEATLRIKLNELIGKEENIQHTAYANMLEVSETFYNEKIKGNVQLINEIKDKYGVDLQNYKSLAEAKIAVENKLLGELAKKWGQFYDVDTDSFTASWEQKKKAMIAAGDGARASVYQDQISAYGNQVQDIKKRFEGIALDLAPVDFDKINLGDIKTEKSSSSPKDVSSDKYKVDKDRYAALNQALADINNSLEVNAALQEKAITTKEKVELLDKEVELLKQKKIATDNLTKEQQKEATELKKSLSDSGLKFNGANPDFANYDAIVANKVAQINKITSTDDKSKAQRQSLINDLEKFKNSYTDYLSLLDKINDSKLDSLKLDTESNKVNSDKLKLIQDETKAEQEALQKANDTKLELYENAEETIVDLLKKRYEHEEDLEEKAHNKRLNDIDKESDKFKKYISDRIDEIDKLKDAEDYNKDINKKTQEITRLQNEIAKYSMAVASGDTESISKVNDLRKELAEKQEDLADTQADHDVKTQKDSLNKMADNVENAYNEQKDAENESYEAYKEMMQKKTDETALQLEAQKLLTIGTISEITNSIIKLFTDTNSNATETGKVLQQQIIDRLAQIQEINKNYSSIYSGSSKSSTSGVSDNTLVSVNQGVEGKNTLETVASVEARQKARYDTAVKAGNVILANQIRQQTEKATGRPAPFDEGGEALGIGTMHKDTIEPERVLSPVQTISFNKLVDFLPNMNNVLNNILPNINTSMPKFTPLTNTGIQFGDIKISVNGSITDANANRVSNSVVSGLKDIFTKAGVINR